jgi:hypothetical protein
VLEVLLASPGTVVLGGLSEQYQAIQYYSLVQRPAGCTAANEFCVAYFHISPLDLLSGRQLIRDSYDKDKGIVFYMVQGELVKRMAMMYKEFGSFFEYCVGVVLLATVVSDSIYLPPVKGGPSEWLLVHLMSMHFKIVTRVVAWLFYVVKPHSRGGF